jgi:hypothetical protein
METNFLAVNPLLEVKRIVTSNSYARIMSNTRYKMTQTENNFNSDTDTFTRSDAILWKPADPKKSEGVQMFVVWGNPNKGASEILLKFPAGMDVGWQRHTAAYHGVVIQGKHTHTFKGAAPQTGGPGSVWSQPAGP